jgi:hypothetical protein
LEFVRKRNALYSRRKYHRKKIEVEVLRNQSTDLSQQNYDLKKEGDRLERLLMAARSQVAIYEATVGRSGDAASEVQVLGFDPTSGGPIVATASTSRTSQSAERSERGSEVAEAEFPPNPSAEQQSAPVPVRRCYL